MDKKSEICDTLREKVKAIGVYEVAERSGLVPKTVYNFMRRESHPSIEACIAIAEAVGYEIKLKKK